MLNKTPFFEIILFNFEAILKLFCFVKQFMKLKDTDILFWETQTLNSFFLVQDLLELELLYRYIEKNQEHNLV